ncbi:MAG: hypothetical protein AAGK78_10475, partial [Planctomycetota bacterium]
MAKPTLEAIHDTKGQSLILRSVFTEVQKVAGHEHGRRVGQVWVFGDGRIDARPQLGGKEWIVEGDGQQVVEGAHLPDLGRLRISELRFTEEVDLDVALVDQLIANGGIGHQAIALGYDRLKVEGAAGDAVAAELIGRTWLTGDHAGSKQSKLAIIDDPVAESAGAKVGLADIHNTVVVRVDIESRRGFIIGKAVAVKVDADSAVRAGNRERSVRPKNARPRTIEVRIAIVVEHTKVATKRGVATQKLRLTTILHGHR